MRGRTKSRGRTQTQRDGDGRFAPSERGYTGGRRGSAPPKTGSVSSHGRDAGGRYRDHEQRRYTTGRVDGDGFSAMSREQGADESTARRGPGRGSTEQRDDREYARRDRDDRDDRY